MKDNQEDCSDLADQIKTLIDPINSTLQDHESADVDVKLKQDLERLHK